MSRSGKGGAKNRKAWLGLGGNLGNVRAAMSAALDALDANPAIAVRAVSGLYRTPPWGITQQPDFLNACAGIETTLAPRELLGACLAAERELKRERTLRWGPRTIDIDILAMEGVSLSTEGLAIPHPRLTERGFALAPLSELAPDLVVRRRKISKWLEHADLAGVERIAGNEWRRSSA